MEKKRWVLILMALCLALAFSVSSVEAQKTCDEDGDFFVKETNKCLKLLVAESETYEGIDCDDTVWNDLNNCAEPPPSPPADFPIIAVVSNSFHGGGAVGHITSEILGGISTNVSVSKFNRLSASDLRKRYDVLHLAYQSNRSIDLDWPKLLLFMQEGGGILIEDPANIEDIEGLMLTHVELHVPGGVPAIVEFAGFPFPVVDPALQYDKPEEILARFTPVQGSSNTTGYFADGDGTFCAFGTGPKRGLGYGCLVNNHIRFATPQMNDTFKELMPLLRLEGRIDDTEAVALYGEGGIFSPGRIILQGTDHGYHAGGGYGDFQDNHFCLLTNELIWLSDLPVSSGTPAQLAIDKCVANSQARRDLNQ